MKDGWLFDQFHYCDVNKACCHLYRGYLVLGELWVQYVPPIRVDFGPRNTIKVRIIFTKPHTTGLEIKEN